MANEREARARRAIAGGVILTFIGVAFITTGSKLTGGPITLVGWAALLFGIHSFGRLGTPGDAER